MRKVFIPSLPTRFDAATNSRVPSLDLNPAAQYGKLVNMTEAETTDTQERIDQIRIAADQIEVTDLILCVGDVVLCAAAIAYATADHGTVSVLRWDKQRHTYDIEEVTL